MVSLSFESLQLEFLFLHFMLKRTSLKLNSSRLQAWHFRPLRSTLTRIPSSWPSPWRSLLSFSLFWAYYLSENLVSSVRFSRALFSALMEKRVLFRRSCSGISPITTESGSFIKLKLSYFYSGCFGRCWGFNMNFLSRSSLKTWWVSKVTLFLPFLLSFPLPLNTLLTPEKMPFIRPFFFPLLAC